MRPEYSIPSSRFLRYRGVESVVAGDSTVAYTGPRGHRENPPGNAAVYLKLAAEHGWSVNGIAGISFVVLDRPSTALPGEFTFSKQQSLQKVGAINRFSDFFPAGGFSAADFIINYAHLTLHGLAGLAGCVKSIAMGCSGLTGKLRMHQSLIPFFDTQLCKGCGMCAKHCPEGALRLDDTTCILAFPEKCIGCGECVAVCKAKAVTLKGLEISDWKLGEETLPERMADYTIGLMNGKWDSTIHVLHMYSITELCDCVDRKQTPFVRDIGFLVSKNPFAVDKEAGRLLALALQKDHVILGGSAITTAEATADYVEKNYGIIAAPPVHTIRIAPHQEATS